MKTVLTIAGSDCAGAGGIQSDIKTITAHNLYATSAITSMTAQNTTGVYDIQESVPKFLGRQLDCVFEDIYPDAVKVGMISNPELLDVVAEKLKQYNAENIVLDTSIVSSNGRHMIGPKAEMIIANDLFPMAALVVMSNAEAEYLSGITIDSIEDMGMAAGIISQKYAVRGILFKEGHKITEKGDLLFEEGKLFWLSGNYDGNDKVLGKGCVLSAAIACGLAEGKLLTDSVIAAKEYVSGAVGHRLNLGKGKNPLNHMFLFDK